MRVKLLFFFAFVTFLNINSQSLQSPAEFLGYEIGERFTRHHKIVEYFKYISENSENVSLEKYGETNEFRPLYLAVISSKENMNTIDEIRKNNLTQTGILNGDATNDKAIVWLSYNVHGNEASSSEAAMLTLYEIITTKQDWLKNTVIIMDPCLNPDGRDRYVNWYNQVKSTPYNTNQDAKEHRGEPWPSGRPNHYLFDLNRDWAWASQVETQQRLKMYNKWMPHVHVDFHEQGINSPYYFAPAAEPFHIIITDWQRDFQTQIGKNNAKYFDENSWLYFTKESFDLLYPSYGDTYPTFMGAIGMTYEQAGHGTAGLGTDTDSGEILTLKNRALHHKTTGLSTVEMSSKNAKKLNSEFRKFFNNKDVPYQSFVMKNNNQDKINQLVDLLKKHEIQYSFAKKGDAKGYNFGNQKDEKFSIADGDLVISTNQPKGKMVNVLFEPKAVLADSLTYDITAWSLPYAYGLEAVALENDYNSTQTLPLGQSLNPINKNAYAYVSKWNSVNDAAFLGDLLKNDITPRFSEKPFTINGNSYDRGTLIVLRTDNKNENFDQKLIDIANNHKRMLTAVTTGFVDKGVDFGSYSVKPINKQKIAVLSGDGTSSLSFGEIWHFFETQLNYPITILDTEYFSRVNLADYDVLIMPNGYYGRILNDNTLDDLNSWVRNGGTLLAIGSAVNSFADKKGFGLKSKKSDEKEDKKPNLTPYADQERENAKNLMTGAIFKSKLDNTHPLAFGYDNSYFTLKLGSSAFDYLENGYNVAYFDDNAKSISGYAGSEAAKQVPESLLVGEERKGRGSIVYMVDNPLFRSFWENGKLFVANAVFFLNSDEVKK